MENCKQPFSISKLEIVLKEKLVQRLVCPACGGELECAVWRVAGAEIEEGMLACQCGESFPIIGSVPRMLLGEFREQLRGDYPAFYEMYGERLAAPIPRYLAPLDMIDGKVGSKQDTAVAATRASFGFEWTRFGEMRPEWEQNFWGYFAPKTAEFFKDKSVLDAGCGMGRHLYYSAKAGAEAIGVDFSRAVDAAAHNTRELPNCHVVQADLAQLPFRPGIFDLIYSLGVLHHLPSPEAVLKSLLGYLKAGGEARIFVYWGGEDAPRWKRAMIQTLAAFRKVTTRLPHAVLHGLCYPISAGMWLTFVLPYQVLVKLPATRQVAEQLPMKQYAAYPFGVLVNDQFDRFSAPLEKRYSRGQVERWLTEAGLREVIVMPFFGWVGHGRK